MGCFLQTSMSQKYMRSTKKKYLCISITSRKGRCNTRQQYHWMAQAQQQQGSTMTRSGHFPCQSSGVTPGYCIPMDINWKRSQDCNCYNCGKPSHITANCRAPKKTTWVQALLIDLKNGKEVKIKALLEALKEEDFQEVWSCMQTN
jgi:hypothetical protein